MTSTTETIIEAMRILARDIESDDAVANMAIAEAADRLEELQAEVERLRAERDQLKAALHVITEAGNEQAFAAEIACLRYELENTYGVTETVRAVV